MKITPRVYHAALTAYCAAIFILSSIPGENFPSVDFDFSDKIVHIVVYGILYLLFFYSLKNQSKSVKLQKFSAAFAILFTAVYGATDEIHQNFVHNRSCEFQDWVADVAGALIVYTFIKINSLKKRNVIACLVLLGLFGCSSSQTLIPEIKINKEEAWLNLMPTFGAEQNILGFLIEFTVTDHTDGKYEVKDLKVYLDNDTISNKGFEQQITMTEHGKINVSIFQSNNVMYLDKSKANPEEAQFSMTLFKNNSKVKTIKTSKIKINKVY